MKYLRRIKIDVPESDKYRLAWRCVLCPDKLIFKLVRAKNHDESHRTNRMETTENEINMWSIVKFKTNDSIKFIPNCWYYNGGWCAFPKITSTVLSFMDKRVEPIKAIREFTFFKCHVLYADILKVIADNAQETEVISHSSDIDTNDPVPSTTQSYAAIKSELKDATNSKIFKNLEDLEMEIKREYIIREHEAQIIKHHYDFMKNIMTKTVREKNNEQLRGKSCLSWFTSKSTPPASPKPSLAKRKKFY